MSAPERIWARPDPATVYMDGSSPLTARDREFHGAAEYVRADVVASQLAEMRAERDEAKDMANALNGDVTDLGQRLEAAEAERDRLAAEVERLRGLLDRVPAAMNSHFSAGMEEREGGSARRQEKLMKYGEDLLSDIASLEDQA